MSPDQPSRIAQFLEQHDKELLLAWVEHQRQSVASRRDLIDEGELREQSQQFLRLLREAAGLGGDDVAGPRWEAVRELLRTLSESRVRLGFSPSETALFVFSLKAPLFGLLQQYLGTDARVLAEETCDTPRVCSTGSGSTRPRSTRRAARRSSPRQQQEMLELSTPGRAALGRHPGAAADRHARQRAHPGRHGEPARSASSTPAPASRSSTSPACRPSTRWSPSTC